MPRIKSNLKPFQWLLDMDKGIAVVPGSGNKKFTVTYREDLARVIVKLLDVDEKWPKRGFLSGSDISINEVIVTAEKIRGTPAWSMVYALERELLAELEAAERPCIVLRVCSTSAPLLRPNLGAPHNLSTQLAG